MSRSWQLRGLGVVLLAVGSACSTAQAAAPAPLSLTQLTHKAGFVFAGRVLRVETPAAVPGTVPVVRVTLQVERALRGVQPGQTFTLTQWAGAWDDGPHYRSGQRLLLFLYPLSSTGLTSVVGGRLGQFDLDSAGNIVLRGDQRRLLSVPDDSRTSNLRPRSPARYSYRNFAGRVQRATTYEP